MAYTLDDLLRALDAGDDKLADIIAAEIGLEPFQDQPLYPCMRDNTCVPIAELLVSFDLF